jgi:hypothetical protein
LHANSLEEDGALEEAGEQLEEGSFLRVGRVGREEADECQVQARATSGWIRSRPRRISVSP